MSRRQPIALAFFALAALASGCHSYLRPHGWDALPARQAAPTRGGEELVVEDGELFVRAAATDVGAALGVSLEEREGAVVVANRLRAGTPLQPGDRIAWVAPVAPTTAARFDHESLSDALERAEARDYLDEVPLPKTLAELRARPGAHAVLGTAELAAYLAGEDWVRLDLGVVRGGGREVVVRQRLRRERRPVPVRLWKPAETRVAGIDACTLDDWPADRLPAHASRGDLLVLRVARDSRAAVAGLRPLDVVSRLALEGLRTLRTAHVSLFQATAPDGASRRVSIRGPRHTDVWIPFLVSYQNDGFRSHFGLGPFDALFHWSANRSYEATTDAYEETRGWSLFTVFQWYVEDRPGGGGAEKRFHAQPIVDLVRLFYLRDWLAARK